MKPLLVLALILATLTALPAGPDISPRVLTARHAETFQQTHLTGGSRVASNDLMKLLRQVGEGGCGPLRVSSAPIRFLAKERHLKIQFVDKAVLNKSVFILPPSLSNHLFIQ